MSVPVVWYTLHRGIDSRGPWDVGILEALFEHSLWPINYEFEHFDMGSGALPVGFTHAIVIVPARHHASAEDVAQLNQDLSLLSGVVLMLIGDEEAIFPWRKVEHPNMRIWLQMPNIDVHGDLASSGFFIGNGWKSDTPALLNSPSPPQKAQDWVFSGQVTHERRKQAVSGLQRAAGRTRGTILETHGFSQGLPRREYLTELAHAKVCPAPSGPCSPDTFRFYEALEAGSIPLADAHAPDQREGYWRTVYPDFPFHEIENWGAVGTLIEELCKDWQSYASQASAWWLQQKRRIARRLEEDLTAIGVPPIMPRPDVTVVITTSPIPSHPSSAILDETLESVGSQLGGVEVIVACDGVRPEQHHLEGSYKDYVRQLCWDAHRYRANVLPVVSLVHRHQAGMMREALQHIDTPLVLFMEHDTPFSEEKIDWESCMALMRYDALDVLRFSHEAAVHPEHTHLMIDHETQVMLGVPLRRTVQFSARPHLARTDYYRRVLRENFSETGSCFIEDRLHGIAQSYPAQHRIAIYHPEGTIRRTLHTDGRGTEPKFDEKQRF